MINSIGEVINFSSIWQYLGPLVGVGFGYLISVKVWDRQKQWEMKRDIIFEVVRSLGELNNSIFALQVAYCHAILDYEDMKAKANAFVSCHTKVSGVRFLADVIVGGRNFDNAISECQSEMTSIAEKVIDGDTDYYRSTQQSLLAKISAVNDAARKELNLKTQYELRRKELTTDHWRKNGYSLGEVDGQVAAGDGAGAGAGY